MFKISYWVRNFPHFLFRKPMIHENVFAVGKFRLCKRSELLKE